MAYGFTSFNTTGQVIVSDTYSSLHFVGKAIRGTDDDGFFEQQSGSERSNFFPDFTGTNGLGESTELDGRVLINYSIITTGRPVVFIKPDASAYDRWYTLCSQTENTMTNEWSFQILMSGITANNFPELFIFVDANSIPNSVLASETHGMIVQNANGEKTFDSRAQPLSILDAKLQRPREYPPNDGTPVTHATFSNYHIGDCTYDTLDHDFHSNGSQIVGFCNNPPIAEGITEANCLGQQGGTNWTQQGDGSVGFSATSILVDNLVDNPLTDLMFSVPASYQAVFTRQAHSIDSLGSPSCFGTAAWWAMYKGANRLQPHATLTDRVSWHTGWGTYAAGYNFSTGDEQPDWDGTTSGDTRTSWIEGLMPYASREAINYDDSSLMIVTNSTRYT